MKLFVAVSLALILICHAVTGIEIDCSNQKECENFKGLICGEKNYGSEKFCINYDPCPFYADYCNGIAKFAYAGDCNSHVGCMD